MIKLLKFIIFLVGLGVISLFILNWMGYAVNYDYLTTSKDQCKERLDECRQAIGEMRKEDGKNCALDCITPSLLIKKQSASDMTDSDPEKEAVQTVQDEQ
ncbi:MAG: hypothetical protein KC736_01785 [Candidatus Moranbacteria bacterium]|nr:hypothetical protein [Candidatus Moranbacteria bacterium]